jgi:hypothetical protein
MVRENLPEHADFDPAHRGGNVWKVWGPKCPCNPAQGTSASRSHTVGVKENKAPNNMHTANAATRGNAIRPTGAAIPPPKGNKEREKVLC